MLNAEQHQDYLMTKQYDVLAIGVAAVDDLLYVSSYPPSNVKVSIMARERHGGGPACTAIATVGTRKSKRVLRCFDVQASDSDR